MRLLDNPAAAPATLVGVQAVFESMTSGFRSFRTVISAIVGDGSEKNEPDESILSMEAPGPLINERDAVPGAFGIDESLRIVDPIRTLDHRVVCFVIELSCAAVS